LGRSNDPGNNVLANNSGTALTFRSTVVCCAVFATGNTWNASVQGADLAGHYPVGTTAAAVTSIQQGRNFVLPSTKVGILF
jgi:hypothetical protein